MFNKKCDCLIGVIISLILGVLVGYIFYLGLITGIIIALWIALGAAVIGLILLIALIISSRKEIDRCICINGKCLGLGILGTLILSTIALSITLAVANVGFAIFIGLLGAFLVLSAISMAKLLCCLINSKCKYREE